MNFKRVTYYIIAGLLLLFGACSKHPVTLCVLETSDLHGSFDPSAAGMAGYIRNVQEEYGSRLMLFDVGDYLQGTPAIYYSGHMDTTGKHLCAAFFDWFPYTAVTVGNHDIEAGMEVFSRVYRQTQVPVLSANIIRKSNGEPYFTPYQIFTVKGYRVAVLGLVTPHVSTWVAERLRPGLTFLSIEASAQYWVSHIRENENPDLVIGLFHTGSRGGAGGFLGNENAALWIAENVPGIDLICYGHDHRPALHQVVNKNNDTVWLMNPGAHGRSIAHAEITLAPGQPVSVHIKQKLVELRDLPPDKDYMEDFASYFKLAADYESKPIARILHTMESNDVFSGPCPWVDEVHRGQLALAGLGSDVLPEVSFASALQANAVIEEGQMFLKDFFTWFPYENSLCVVEMTGNEIKDYLEYSCDQTAIINFDTAAGILYTVYKDRPAGDRIIIHGMADGFAFVPERKYHVVMNSYRAQGGGGHLFNGPGWDAATASDRIVWESKTDMRKLLMEWEASRSPFNPEPLNHWQYK